MTGEDRKFEVLVIARQRSDHKDLYRATIRISNVMRSALQHQGDVIALGINEHRVKDSFYVKRCYKCQGFGHQSTECQNSTVCGHCAGPHDTRSGVCNSLGPYCCINCKNAGLSPIDHAAYFYGCPVQLDRQERLKKSIPFYQGKMTRKRY